MNAIVLEGIVHEEYGGEGPLGGDVIFYDIHDAEDTPILWGELELLKDKRIRVTIEVLK